MSDQVNCARGLIADFIEDTVAHEMACLDRPLTDVARLLINPPTFRLTFEDVITQLGDTDGDGSLSRPERSAALMGPPFNFDALAASLFVPAVTGRVHVDLVPSADILTAGGITARPGVAIGEAEGAFNDDTILAFARGAAIAFGGTVTADLRALREACDVGDVSSPLCAACEAGGLCETTAGVDCSLICAGGGLRDETSIDVPPTAIAPLVVPPSPWTSNLIGAAPLFAESIRRLFFNALPPGGRYTSFSSSLAGEFTYRIDPDDDRLDTYLVDTATGAGPDLCPDVFDPSNEDDGDGDIFGAVCDACPGVRSACANRETCRDNGDVDGDTLPNGCDCDIDGDGCLNPAAIHGGHCVEPPVDRGFDLRPYHASGVDFAGDGTPDDCDLDFDNDGVPNAEDSCPYGDGDGVFVAGVDDNPTQVDSGCATEGDLCDPLCSFPGDSDCDVCERARTSAEPPRGEGDMIPGGLPMAGCFSGGDCNLWWLLECAAQNVGDCFGLGGQDLLAVTPEGQLLERFDNTSLGLDADFAGAVGAFPDLDGDGLMEIMMASPGASVCSANQSCQPGAGQLLLVSSTTGVVLERFGYPLAGSLGTSFAVSRRTIAVGAPNALDDQGRAVGALYLFRREERGFRLHQTIFGLEEGERFGASVAAVPGEGPSAAFLVGAPLANGPGRARAGVLRHVEEVGGVVAEYHGPLGDGQMSSGVAFRDGHGRLHVAGLMPAANGGAGAVAFFHGYGPARLVVPGRRPGDRLGTAGTIMPTGLGTGDLVVSAPGANGGRGELLQFSGDGRVVGRTRYFGTQLGTGLVAVPDTNGDGIDDVAAGLDYGGAATVVFRAMDSSYRGRHRP